MSRYAFPMAWIYDTPEGVARYREFSEGIDGRVLVDELVVHLPEGGEVLELGSALGKDLAMLAEHFVATGSDPSAAFREVLRAELPAAEILELDARTLISAELPPARQFDGIYSNKVLHHLEKHELRASFLAQRARLRRGGVALHSFWPGEERTEQEDLVFQMHTEEGLAELVGSEWRIERIFRYNEVGHEDSLCMVLRAV